LTDLILVVAARVGAGVPEPAI